MPIVVRVTLFVAAIGGGVSFAGLTLVGLLFPVLLPVANLAGMLAMITALPLAVLLLVKAGNASPGAIDNASGVGTVLHLAECLTAHPDPSASSGQALDNRLRVTILITSAEEFGLLGVAAYLQQNESRLRQHTQLGGLYILNFDGVGVDGSLYYTDAPARSPGRLVNLLREACGELGIPMRKYSLPGALFDHMPFAQRGFDAVSLTTIGRATRFVHTPGDSADKLDARGFEQAGRVALRVLEKLGNLGNEGK
jgi:Zn-dependent M28 family amino/carboxypeptidase